MSKLNELSVWISNKLPYAKDSQGAPLYLFGGQQSEQQPYSKTNGLQQHGGGSSSSSSSDSDSDSDEEDEEGDAAEDSGELLYRAQVRASFPFAWRDFMSIYI